MGAYLYKAITCASVGPGCGDEGPEKTLFGIAETVYAYTQFKPTDGFDFYGHTVKHEWWYNGEKKWEYESTCDQHYTANWCPWSWWAIGVVHGPGTGHIRIYFDGNYMGKTNDYAIIAAGHGMYQVGGNTDQCRKKWTGAAWNFSLISIRQDVGYWDGDEYKYGGGMRFLNVDIPKDAVLIGAYLVLAAGLNFVNDTVKSKIHGEAADNPGTFTTVGDYDGRVRTVAEVLWDSIPHWIADAWYASPDIKDIIQEIIDQPGWNPGNSMVIFWDDHDDRSTHLDQRIRGGHTYNVDPELAPVLMVTYTVAPPGTIAFHAKLAGMI